MTLKVRKKKFFLRSDRQAERSLKRDCYQKRLGSYARQNGDNNEKSLESCESNDLMRRKIAPHVSFFKTLRIFPNSHLLSWKTTKDKFCVVRQRES